MDFDTLFNAQLDTLKKEGNYRIFAELERNCGAFPRARCHDDDTPDEVTVWCSNDYLGMGQHPKVIAAIIAREKDLALALAAPATSRAPTTSTSCWSGNSRTCTARTMRCCSPAATCRTGPPCRRWAADCPMR